MLRLSSRMLVVVLCVVLVGLAGAGTADASHAVTSLSPDALPQGAESRTVVINGSGFSAALGQPTVTVSGSGVTVTDVNVDSPTRITTKFSVTNGATQGFRDVTVTQGLGLHSFECQSCVRVNLRPTITSFTPTEGANASPTPPATVNLVVNGSGFVPGSVLALRRSGLPDIVSTGTAASVDGTALSGTLDLSGKAPGRWRVEVDNPDGGHAASGDGATTGFLITGPTITSVTPNSGAQGVQNGTIVVNGSGFDSAPTVSFSGTGITVDSVTRESATKLTVVIDIAPNAPTGSRNLTVTNPNTGSATAAGGFTVNAAPTTTALNPNSIDPGSLRPVTITGTGYVETPTVSASGTGVTFQNVAWHSSTRLTATVGAAPNAPAGPRDVFVVNPDGGSSVCVGCLTVAAPSPNMSLDGWVGIGDPVLSTPAVVSVVPDTAAVLYRGSDNSVQQRNFANDTFQPRTSLGGVALSGPAAAAAGGVADIVVRGADDAVWIKTCSGGSCGGWSSVGGQTRQAPAAVAWGPGRLDVFVAGLDSQLWQRTRTNGSWGSWMPLGGALTAGPAATSTAAGNIEVAVRGTDGGVWLRSFNSTWSAYSTIGGFIANEPALVARPGGFVDLFVRAGSGDNRLWYARRTAGAWGGFSPLGGILTSGPAAALISTSPQPVEMIAARGADGNLWVNRARYQ